MVLKVITSWNETSREMKRGSTILSQSMDWKHPHVPAKQKFETHPTTEKLMLTDFGTHKGYYSTVIKRGVQQ